ncbi:MAG: riboflavin biosynthesis protein RibF [Lachnospiraceae bacterium]|nr:riboflavin biosynthesis protein RibF [Lachnospiraceae bacterium]
MKLFRSFEELNITESVSMTIGKFDGVHKGHADLIERLSGKRFVFTFDISEADGLITTASERRERFESLGVDYLFECPFDRNILNMTPEVFLSELFGRANIRKIVVGRDFRFGRDRAGDCDTLMQKGKEFGYETEIAEKLKLDDREISSSYIREEISNGHMENVERLLGLPYFCDGTVVTGNKIGRTIGFPTANVPVNPAKLMPPFGVYKASLATKDGLVYADGIADLGRKPTIRSKDGVNPVCIEINLFDFDMDIYGRDVRILLRRFIRPERKFDSVDALKLQIAEDIKSIKR